MRRFAVAFALFAALAAPLAATGAQAADPVRVRAGYIPVLGSGQLFIVDQKGWAKQAGIELTPQQFDSGPNMIQALASGTLEAYVGGVGPLLVARGKGIKVKVVAALATEELVLVGGGAFAKAVAGGKTPKQVIEDAAAAGKKIKIATQPAGSVPQTVLLYWLVKVAGVDLSKVDIVPMGIDATQLALLAGAVDAATIREPAVTIVQKRDPSFRVVVSGAQMFPAQPGSVLALTEDFLAKQPQAAQALVSQFVRATELLQTNPKEAAPALGVALGRGIVDEATLIAAIQSPNQKFGADPQVIVASTDEMQRFQKEQGVLERTIPIEELFDRSLFVKATAQQKK
ncbi:MAG: nitrate transporter substrate-binding protein [Rhodospirillales bacterium]|nr:nitrate transporter substrate-binding protein [Rhodospirillales bacterium]